MIYHKNYENKDLLQILNTFSHKQQVSFAFYCSKDVEHFTNDQRVIDCNQVLQLWLKGDKTIDLELTNNNVWNAWSDAITASRTAYTASRTAITASRTAYTASRTAYTASRTAITASRTASRAAYYAVSAAANAASAKSSNLYPKNYKKQTIAYKQFYNEYKQIAQNWLSYWTIPNFPKDELDFPIFDYLQDFNLISSLLPKKRKYYHLNLNGFDIKHVDEAELLKIINTTHIKNILRRIINNDSSS